eukprot:TRINITY_DN13197_c0_g1_i1.p1 TRINITY_DN13197_c0_g1~~TRINITY_DN13197_c0_g1_i1.p1  ORF type:complete len:163 (+),score=46.32 TRINITY_DN13197_c0_g1_i1:40-528(+)
MQSLLRSFAPALRGSSASVPRLFLARGMSIDATGSHPDFAAAKKQLHQETDENIKETLDWIGIAVKDDPVVLFMKGTPEQPQCGFSRRVVTMLQQAGVRYSAYNVLEDPALREGVKKFSNWPTIPQLYVQGEFVGGCDIVTEMSQNGELKPLLEKAAAAKSR